MAVLLASYSQSTSGEKGKTHQPPMPISQSSSIAAEMSLCQISFLFFLRLLKMEIVNSSRHFAVCYLVIITLYIWCLCHLISFSKPKPPFFLSSIPHSILCTAKSLHFQDYGKLRVRETDSGVGCKRLIWGSFPLHL